MTPTAVTQYELYSYNIYWKQLLHKSEVSRLQESWEKEI